jgi:drug/metabolite transporter (DMT)-like permease
MSADPIPSPAPTSPAVAPARPVVATTAIDWLGLGAALLTVALWASAFVGIRAAGQDLSPGALAFGRLLVGTAALGLLVAATRPTMPRGRDLVLVVAAGVVWFGGYNVSLNAAEQLVDAGTAAMLVSVGPLLIVAFAGWFLKEGFPPRLLAGSGVAFVGALLIGLATSDGAGSQAMLGIGLSLLAAAAYAAGVTLQKPALSHVSALTVTFLACAVGALVTAPFAPALMVELPTTSIGNVAWMVYLGVFPTAVAFTTWAFALSRTTAGRLGATSYLVAPVAIVMAWLILDEVPPLVALAGGALSIAGVAIARSRPAR